MKKPFKVMSAGALATVLATSALVPVISASAEEAATLQSVIVTKNDVNYKVTLDQYNDAIDAGTASDLIPGHITTSNNQNYTLDQFNDALDNADGNVTAALATLVTSGTPVTLETVDAEFDGNGNLIENGEEPAPDVVVESVTAINNTTIAIEFNQEVEDFNIADLSSTGLVFDSATVEGNTVLVGVKGAAFNTSYKVDLKDQGSYDVKFGSVNDYYRLDFSYDAEDTNDNDTVDIPANGSSTLQVTAQVVDLEGNPQNAEGVIRFTTTAGGIAQGEKTLQNGKAAIQLTSEASLNESIFASVTAEIVGSSKFIGLTSKDIVEFKPETETGVVETAVNVVKVESAAADRFQAILGQPRAELSDVELNSIKNALVVTDGIKGSSLAVKEVIQLTPSVLEVILDTEADDSNHFTDNAKHTVEFGAVTNVLTNSIIDFILTDTSKQFVLNVGATDQRTLEVTYTEPVAFASAGNPATAVYFANNHLNYAIDGVTIDANSTFKLSEDRKKVTIGLVAKDAIKVKETNLEIKNVGDWAGTTDPKNRISTQRIEFTANIDDSVPTLNVIRQSPEQFLIEVDKDVTLKTGTDLADVLETRAGAPLEEDEDAPDTGKKGDLSKLFDAVVGGANHASGDVVYTTLDKDMNIVNSATTEFRYILVEFTEDWTEILDGSNYWVDAPAVQFKLAKNLLSTDLDNKNVALNTKVANTRDRVSPSVAVDKDGNKEFDQVDQTIVYTMNEPVQVVSDDVDLNGTTGSLVPLTPNAEQAGSNNGKVQATEINFEKDNIVVPGVVLSLDPTDHTITAEASYGGQTGDDALKAAVAAYNLTNNTKVKAEGSWTVVITGTPDDFGNTMATEEFVDGYIVGEATTPIDEEALTIDPFVAYGKYFNNVDLSDVADLAADDSLAGTGIASDAVDVIHVKFSEVMSNSGANAVGDTTNYVLNGKTLAELGSSVQRGIAGVTNDWDGITITLPKGTLGEDANFVLTLASNMVSKDDTDKKLTGANELNFVDADLLATGTKLSEYAPGLFLTNTNSKALKPLDVETDLIVNEGATVATAFTSGDDEEFADDLEIKITFSDDATLRNHDNTKDLQITVNGKVVPASAIDTTAEVLTIEFSNEAELKAAGLETIKDGDRIEVKINGQTVYVDNVTTP